jgi:hypothetical protein
MCMTSRALAHERSLHTPRRPFWYPYHNKQTIHSARWAGCVRLVSTLIPGSCVLGETLLTAAIFVLKI